MQCSIDKATAAGYIVDVSSHLSCRIPQPSIFEEHVEEPEETVKLLRAKLDPRSRAVLNCLRTPGELAE